jgi:hypothetical protein
MRKSRSRRIHTNNHCEYRLNDASRNAIILGENFDASLEEIWQARDQAAIPST